MKSVFILEGVLYMKVNNDKFVLSGMFSDKEILTIYVALEYFKNMCKSMAIEFPILTMMNYVQRDEYETNQEMIKSAESTMAKFDKYFNSIGIDIKSFL